MWRGYEHHVLTQDQLERRASGRRRYNSWRQFLARYRQAEVARLLAEGLALGAIAARCQVSLSTIRRDWAALMHPERGAPCCPTCGRPYAPHLPPGVLP